jgi:hypothetical protein
MLNAYGYFWCHDPEDDDIDPYLNLPNLRGRIDRRIYLGEDGSGQSCGWMIERRDSERETIVEFGISDTFDGAKHDFEAAILRNLTGHERIALGRVVN